MSLDFGPVFIGEEIVVKEKLACRIPLLVDYLFHFGNFLGFPVFFFGTLN